MILLTLLWPGTWPCPIRAGTHGITTGYSTGWWVRSYLASDCFESRESRIEKRRMWKRKESKRQKLNISSEWQCPSREAFSPWVIITTGVRQCVIGSNTCSKPVIKKPSMPMGQMLDRLYCCIVCARKQEAMMADATVSLRLSAAQSKWACLYT